MRKRKPLIPTLEEHLIYPINKYNFCYRKSKRSKICF